MVILVFRMPLPHDNRIRGVSNLYIATQAHRVRKVAPSGVISTVAGTGVAGTAATAGRGKEDKCEP